jgi:hypothetical protein
MKNFVLSALTVLFALTTGLRAQDSAIVAHVDHEFVAAGKTFPAGTYRFVPDVNFQFLTVRNNDGGASAFVIPMIFESTSAEHEHLTLERVAGVSYLSEIATPVGVYTLAVPRVSTRLAKQKEQDVTSSAGTN